MPFRIVNKKQKSNNNRNVTNTKDENEIKFDPGLQSKLMATSSRIMLARSESSRRYKFTFAIKLG